MWLLVSAKEWMCRGLGVQVDQVWSRMNEEINMARTRWAWV